MRGCVRVGRWAGMTAGELGRDGLAQNGRTGTTHQGYARRIGNRSMAGIDRRAHFGRHVVCVDDVFDPEWYSVE